MEVKNYHLISQEFGVSESVVPKYIAMTEEDISDLINGRKQKKRARKGDAFVNIIYKMMQDNYSDDIIYYYLVQEGFVDSPNLAWDYIRCISVNNYPKRKRIYGLKRTDLQYPSDVIVIKRMELLKYILTLNPKTKKDETIGQYIDVIKAGYPIVEFAEAAFREFREVLMGKDPEKVDDYLQKYKKTKIGAFCDSIKKDIIPVKNAVSSDVSSGFVEGNNNKFKLIKRIVYGRSKIGNLSKKCFLAFSMNREDFNLQDIL